MIRTDAMTKRFGPILAVDGVDLDVREGDRYGLLGPNGSGKTTLVRLLLGLVFATSGRIEVLDRPVPRRGKDVLPEVGALVEGPAGYPHLSGRTNLALFDAAPPERLALREVGELVHGFDAQLHREFLEARRLRLCLRVTPRHTSGLGEDPGDIH